MKVYVYRAALLCEDCANAAMALLDTRADSGDSDSYPQGPYSDGGGEADTPQHCGHCRVFLENPLTDDGREYVRDALDAAAREGTPSEVLNTWADFYKLGTDYINLLEQQNIR